MKKFILILSVFVSLFSCSDDETLNPTNENSAKESIRTTTARLASSTNVKLFKAWTSYSQLYGYATYTRRFQVEVRNLAYHKKVFIMHEMSDGTWKDYPLNYLTSTLDNTEIWGADSDTFVSYYDNAGNIVRSADEFVVRYEANGQTYWDNNNWQNYKMNDLEGTYLREDVNLSVDMKSTAVYADYNSNSSGTNTFSIHVDVRNIAYHKEVKVLYTTDNWNTVQVEYLSFMPSMTVGARQFLTSPNRFNIERWSARIQIPSTAQTIKFAVVYKVNGIEYWDNNYGNNYSISR